jgi:hypothetical protein
MTLVLAYIWRNEVALALKSRMAWDRCEQLIEEGKSIDNVALTEEWRKVL